VKCPTLTIEQIAPATFPSSLESAVVEDPEELEFCELNFSEPEPESVQVREQKQKGLGLQTLQKSLSAFSDLSTISAPDNIRTEEERERSIALERQMRVEADTMSSALDRWRSEHIEHMKLSTTVPHLKNVEALMWSWHERLLVSIAEEIKEADAAEVKPANEARTKLNRDRSVYAPFLQALSPAELSIITITHCVNQIAKMGATTGEALTRLACSLGKAVEQESDPDTIMLKDKKKPKWAYGQQLNKRGYQPVVIKRRRPGGRHPSIPELTREEWSSALRARVGVALITLLIKVAKVEVTQTNPKTGKLVTKLEPAFAHNFVFQGGRENGMLQMHPKLCAKLSKEPVSSTICKALPMLVEPVPWTDYKKGGFILQKHPVVRLGTQHSQNKEYIYAAVKAGDLDQLFTGLDILGKTPWKINRPVFDTMLEVWNSGEAFAKIPAENPVLEYPKEPDAAAEPMEHRQYSYEMKKLEDKRMGFHSQRCFQNFQLEVARAFLDETFYFPHNVDFRGRAYPIPPYLNHMGADNCRGLLLFAKGKELGIKGLDWLKVHLANVYGFDKASFDERRDFATEHITNVYDSATNPLKGSQWWRNAEDPWQCLATCIELKNALDMEDPTKYVSYLPVHQDGTCNGLQHYAALGGDAIGAKQVNLEPGERPSDIYSGVADLVGEEVAKDAKDGHPAARLLADKITRKIVKRTVMTSVYGVTFKGAQRQVAEALEDMHPELAASLTMGKTMLSTYIARKVFGAMGRMFKGATHIQTWLGECGSRICVSVTPDQMRHLQEEHENGVQKTRYGRPAINEKLHADEFTRFKTGVIWTTPLRLPVVQPYREGTTRHLTTNLSKLSIQEPNTADAVSKRKQLAAFPPNFIHSLDATHMLLSALKSNELGLSFAAVHDSFWTHAADVDTMNGFLRDSFIEMHSEDITGRLAAEFSARYKGCMYLAYVKHTSPIGQKIYAHRAAVRAKKMPAMELQKIELLEEERRQKLLASHDLKEREEGKAMVTPGSIYEQASGPSDFAMPDELVELANIPEVAVDPFDDAMTDEKKLVIRRASRAKWQRLARKVWVWLPISFPPVPKRVRWTSYVALEIES
jgi:DNA-directed RNA polymerase